MPRLRAYLAFFALVVGCADRPALVTITLAHDSPAEQRTRDQLTRLLAAHDLGRFVRTHQVRIDEDAIPHSHPVLTLHTRHGDDDDLLLSTFLHEQMHWWVDERPQALDAAVAELRAELPGLPVGFPDGARDERSSYEHLVVDHLEIEALGRVRGPDVARRVLDFWSTDHYRALYRLERERGTEIGAIIARHGIRL